ncbi:MAG: CDP-alcohol phosphatidyltransferase family protein, partial [Chloroflexi bacterium]|nr:CDP-alcohol phosphatidyltransferase family protein [Chloroflexota bacterium]
MIEYRLRVLIPNILSASGLALAIFSILASSRGEFDLALRLIILAGIVDGIDGALARRW